MAPIQYDIVDIFDPNHLGDLEGLIYRGLSAAEGERTLPTLLLYDKKGLQLFEQITYSDFYYLTNLEIEILKNHAHEIARQIKPGSLVVELGSGNLRKTALILHALESLQRSVTYYALDVNRAELERSLHDIDPSRFSYVKVAALHGTYDDAKEWLSHEEGQKCILWLGSSIGNETRQSAKEFLYDFKKTALRTGDSVVIGIDRRNESERVWRAYNDGKITTAFELNGLANANKIIGQTLFKDGVWEYVGLYDEKRGCHEAFFVPNKNVQLPNGYGVVRKGERIQIESSYKYSAEEIAVLLDSCGLTESLSWSDKSNSYVYFPLEMKEYPPLPTLNEWRTLWKTWDLVTLRMIPEHMLLKKPIDLRNACIFYLGHIPTFLDIHLSRAIDAEPVPPEEYRTIFERGIDPDVDNPDHCHAHSEIPDSWPSLQELLDFKEKVRQRLIGIYQKEDLASNEMVKRRLWLGYEHEAMHLETLLYMLVQSDETLPPPGIPTPDWEALAESALEEKIESWIDVPEKTIIHGLDDSENRSEPGYFGWDIEAPRREVRVGGFSARSRPISNGDYYKFAIATRIPNDRLPKSWTVVNAKVHVRTVFGSVPLELALNWPAIASYDEFSRYAEWAGGRMPTDYELRSLYEEIEQKPATLAETIDAVNGQLTESGVNETPPRKTGVQVKNGVNLSYDVYGTNLGFKHWHPMPMKPNANVGVGAGGAWEWTSTPLRQREGYIQSTLYPAYSSDFFDTKHNIVHGGSWATVPRIAGRKSFVNWYQRNYPYAWVTARLVKDQ